MTNDERRANAIVTAVEQLAYALADIGVDRIRAITLDGPNDADRVAKFIARSINIGRPRSDGARDIRIRDIRII